MPENRWIEIISLRFSSPDHRQMVLDLFNQVLVEITKTPDISRYAELYVNTNVETDWSIYLHWNRLREEHPSKTVLGRNIAESLRSFGLVNHSVWERKGR